MIIITVECQCAWFVVSTATNWTPHIVQNCGVQVTSQCRLKTRRLFEAPHLFMFLYIFCIGGGGLDCQLWKEPTGDRYTSLCAPGADGPLSVVFGVWCAWWWQRFCSTSGRHQKQLSSGSHEPRDISCHSRCYVHCSVAKLGWHMNLLQMPFRLLRQETSTAQLPCSVETWILGTYNWSRKVNVLTNYRGMVSTPFGSARFATWNWSLFAVKTSH